MTYERHAGQLHLPSICYASFCPLSTPLDTMSSPVLLRKSRHSGVQPPQHPNVRTPHLTLCLKQSLSLTPVPASNLNCPLRKTLQLPSQGSSLRSGGPLRLPSPNTTGNRWSTHTLMRQAVDFRSPFQRPCTLNWPDGVASELMHHLYQGFYENEGLKPKPQSVWNLTFSLVKNHNPVCNHIQSITWLNSCWRTMTLSFCLFIWVPLGAISLRF